MPIFYGVRHGAHHGEFLRATCGVRGLAEPGWAGSHAGGLAG